MGKRSEFNDIAYGLLHGFISRYNAHDGYWALGKLHSLARQRGTTRLSLEFWPQMPGQVALGDVFAVAQARYTSWLARQVAHHALPTLFLQRATIELDFERNDLAMRANMQGLNSAPPLLCRAILIDDRGRVYECEALTMCRPHDPARESRSALADQPA